MTRRSLIAPALLAVAFLCLPGTARAQQFKMEKFNIGGEGGTDYIVAEAGSNRVFVSRQTHVMVIDGLTGKVLGDIPNTPRMHGIGLAPKSGHGFTTNAGDSSLTMFDLKTLAFIKKIPIKVGGLDGIMYSEIDDRIILTNHSKPGTAVAINPTSGDITGTAELEDTAPEGAASDGKGRIYINNEGTNTIQVVEVKAMKVVASWPLAPCDGPTGIAYDKPSNRIFVGCSKTSVVVDGTSGKVVAQIVNSDRVDALGWDGAQKLIYIPGGAPGNVTIVHQDSPDKYTVVATVATVPGAKTIAVDAAKHVAYFFQPEFGPAPAGATPPAGGRGARGPMVAAWFVVVKQ